MTCRATTTISPNYKPSLPTTINHNLLPRPRPLPYSHNISITEKSALRVSATENYTNSAPPDYTFHSSGSAEVLKPRLSSSKQFLSTHPTFGNL